LWQVAAVVVRTELVLLAQAEQAAVVLVVAGRMVLPQLRMVQVVAVRQVMAIPSLVQVVTGRLVLRM
jgi:hypothetical protein